MIKLADFFYYHVIDHSFLLASNDLAYRNGFLILPFTPIHTFKVVFIFILLMIYSLSLLLVFKFLNFCKIEITVFRFDVIRVIGSKINPRI